MWDFSDLVDLLPPLRVLRPDDRVVVQQRLAQHGVDVGVHGQVERREALGVLVVGRGAQVQQRLHRLEVVLLDGAVHGRGAVARAVVEQRAAVHQRQQHARRASRRRRHCQRRFCGQFKHTLSVTRHFYALFVQCLLWLQKCAHQYAKCICKLFIIIFPKSMSTMRNGEKPC